MDMQNVIEGIANGMARKGNVDTLKSFSAYVDSLPVEEGVGPVKSLGMCLLAIATLASGCSNAEKRVPAQTDTPRDDVSELCERVDALLAEVKDKMTEIDGWLEQVQSDVNKSFEEAKAKSDAEEAKRLEEMERQFNAIMAQK